MKKAAERNEEMIKIYKQGTNSVAEIAEMYGLSKTRVWRILKTNNVTLDSTEKADAIINYCKECNFEITIPELAKHFDMEYNSAYQFVRRHNLVLKGKKESTLERIKSVDTTKYTSAELYEMNKDITKDLRSFESLLYKYNISYKSNKFNKLKEIEFFIAEQGSDGSLNRISDEDFTEEEAIAECNKQKALGHENYCVVKKVTTTQIL